MTIVFYISGHGFGHATRDIEVMEAILRRRPGTRIVVRTAVAPRLFATATRAPIDVQAADTDTGMVQIDSLRLDEAQTVQTAARFYADFPDRVSREASALRALSPAVVVADMPPLAMAAARAAGVPSVALGNFSWDWIYEAYPQFHTLAPGVLPTIRAAYAEAALALRLPFHGGFETMAGVVRDIPLIARASRLGREAARHALELDDTQPIVLSSFGAYGVALPYEQVAARQACTLMVTDQEMPQGPAKAGRHEATDHDALRWLPMDALAKRGLRYPDLVAAADIVVSKPGYGIVSECIANRAALLYTSRGRFPEQDVLVAGMPRVLRARHIALDQLTGGDWAGPIDTLLGQPQPPATLDITGADCAAEEILRLC